MRVVNVSSSVTGTILNSPMREVNSTDSPFRALLSIAVWLALNSLALTISIVLIFVVANITNMYQFGTHSFYNFI